MLTKKLKFTKINLINFFISFFPLSFLMGNLAININIILVCLLGLAIYRFEIFIVNQKILKYLIYSFFLYIVLLTLIRNLPNLINIWERSNWQSQVERSSLWFFWR